MACLVLFQNIIHDSPPSRLISELFRLHGKTRVSILELGTGCGLVGISVATIFPQTEVLLTDLPDAEQLVLLNMNHAKSARTSGLKWQVLDWSHPLQKKDLPSRIDLVIVADCVYNTTSIPYLVQTIMSLLDHRPDAKFLIARKPRHESEELFFELIRASSLCLLESWNVALPQVKYAGSVDSVVEFHLYGRS